MLIDKAVLAKSSQLNAVDLVQPVTVTITDAYPGKDDTEVLIVTDLFGKGRPYMPPKSVLRAVGTGWGIDTTLWIGRRMTIYNLPSVTYGGEAKGGVRISAMSNIDKTVKYVAPLADGLGKNHVVTIQPLPDAPKPDISTHMAALAAADSMTALQGAWGDVTRAGLGKDPRLEAEKERMKAVLT